MRATRPGTISSTKSATFRGHALVLAVRGRIGIEQPVQMDDEIAHLRIVHGLLRLAPPSRIGGGVIRVDADDVELVEVLEFGLVEAAQLSAEYEMEQLLGFAAHRWFPRPA